MPNRFSTFEDIMSERYSCRCFRPDPLPRREIEAVLACAQKTPSWCNAQPWQVIVTSGAETERLREALGAAVTGDTPAPDIEFPAGYSGVYQDRRRTCGWALYEAVGVKKGDRAGSAAQMMLNFSFFGAPHVALISTDRELGPYGAIDCGGYITAFTLAARARGIATIPQAAVASYAPFLHHHFDIPDTRQVVCAISFGWEDPAHPANGFRTDRAPLDDVVTWVGTSEDAA